MLCTVFVILSCQFTGNLKPHGKDILIRREEIDPDRLQSGLILLYGLPDGLFKVPDTIGIDLHKISEVGYAVVFSDGHTPLPRIEDSLEVPQDRVNGSSGIPPCASARLLLPGPDTFKEPFFPHWYQPLIVS